MGIGEWGLGNDEVCRGGIMERCNELSSAFFLLPASFKHMGWRDGKMELGMRSLRFGD